MSTTNQFLYIYELKQTSQPIYKIDDIFPMFMDKKTEVWKLCKLSQTTASKQLLRIYGERRQDGNQGGGP